MSEQTTTPADPLSTGDPTQTPASATAQPGAPTSSQAPAPDPTNTDIDAVLQLVQEQQAAIAQLQRDLATRGPQPNPSATVSSTAPAGGPTPAAFDNGAPAHAMHSADSADLTEGDVIRFNVPSAAGGDPITGYGMVLEVVDVADRDENGNPTGATHPEFVVARLDVLGVRLQAANVVDEESSLRVHEQLTANG